MSGDMGDLYRAWKEVKRKAKKYRGEPCQERPMTDRELLEAAAKAAGIVLVPYTWNKGTGWDHEGFTVAGQGPDEWNPLEDDGDALRLAVKLRMAVDIGGGGFVNALCGEPNCTEEMEDVHPDPYAAARRAIVRAAAARAEGKP